MDRLTLVLVKSTFWDDPPPPPSCENSQLFFSNESFPKPLVIFKCILVFFDK